jgi:hypothetical protein
MNPDHIVGTNEMIGPLPTAGDHIGETTDMVKKMQGRDPLRSSQPMTRSYHPSPDCQSSAATFQSFIFCSFPAEAGTTNSRLQNPSVFVVPASAGWGTGLDAIMGMAGYIMESAA